MAILKANTTFYIHSDQLNTPKQISDSQGRTRWAWDSLTFGATSPNENPKGLGQFTFNVRHAGQYYDAESGLFENWHRSYSPLSGRYIQSDPIGLAGGINTYAYVENNPLSFVDPTGEFANLLIGGVTSAATGYFISLATGECYNYKNLLIDAALGATGAGLIAKLEKLRELSKLRTLVNERGLTPNKITSQIKDYINPANPIERLKIKNAPSLNAPGSLSQVARVEYRVAPGTFQNPFTGAVGKTAEYSHVPIGIPSQAGAVAGGAAGGALGQGLCGCQQ